MIEESEYKMFRSIEGVFGDKVFGIKILVAGADMPDMHDMDDPHGKLIYRAGSKAIDGIQAELLAYSKFLDPKTAIAAKKEREELLALFTQPIYVEEIPNGYCSDYCCRHLPWFIVTTTLGRIKIGWRKRVIEIDWSDSKSDVNGEKDFSKDNVTKGRKDIHAWSLKDAQRYLNIILGLAPKESEPEEGAL